MAIPTTCHHWKLLMETIKLPSAQDDPRGVPDRLKLPFCFDTVLLAENLASLGEKWTRHYVPQNYSGDWSVIPLRAPSGETHPIRMIYSDPTQKIFVDTEALQACSY